MSSNHLVFSEAMLACGEYNLFSFKNQPHVHCWIYFYLYPTIEVIGRVYWVYKYREAPLTVLGGFVKRLDYTLVNQHGWPLRDILAPSHIQKNLNLLKVIGKNK